MKIHGSIVSVGSAQQKNLEGKTPIGDLTLGKEGDHTRGNFSFIRRITWVLQNQVYKNIKINYKNCRKINLRLWDSFSQRACWASWEGEISLGLVRSALQRGSDLRRGGNPWEEVHALLVPGGQEGTGWASCGHSFPGGEEPRVWLDLLALFPRSLANRTRAAKFELLGWQSAFLYPHW